MNHVMLLGQVHEAPSQVKSERNPTLNMVKMKLQIEERMKQGVQVHHIPIVMFGSAADDAMRTLRAGDLAMVDGKVNARTREKAGVSYTNVDVVGLSVQKLGASQHRDTSARREREPGDDDDLAF